ncbi:hypothetical protein B0H19DRAFT_1256285 [Mycena capillaripes]|nr:hypothetical protein B0H19DRAFT_1256285 [Mycena capillaripes]
MSFLSQGAQSDNDWIDTDSALTSSCTSRIHTLLQRVHVRPLSPPVAILCISALSFAPSLCSSCPLSYRRPMRSLILYSLPWPPSIRMFLPKLIPTLQMYQARLRAHDRPHTTGLLTASGSGLGQVSESSARGSSRKDEPCFQFSKWTSSLMLTRAIYAKLEYPIEDVESAVGTAFRDLGDTGVCRPPAAHSTQMRVGTYAHLCRHRSLVSDHWTWLQALTQSAEHIWTFCLAAHIFTVP